VLHDDERTLQQYSRCTYERAESCTTRRETPEPLAALADVRRDLEQARDPRREPAEWATPTLFLRGPPLPLFDRSAGLERVEAPPDPDLGEKVVVRQVGDFVGRRRELRAMLRDLRSGERGDVLMQGIGGVGKSTVAAQAIATLGPDAGVVVSVSGEVAVDQVLSAVAGRLLDLCFDRNYDEQHPVRRMAGDLRDASKAWSDRVAQLRRYLATVGPVLLLAAGGDAGRVLADEHLAAFLASWLTAPAGLAGAPGLRLLVTSRHPFPLPSGAGRRLAAHHLGPLSFVETRKLLWRLPGIDALPAADRQRAYAVVGGHLRALEYLDALLRGGQARFADIRDRLEAALHAEGVDRPDDWLRGFTGDIDRSLAETVTRTAGDVLLAELLDRLDAVPLARRLLLGASVYREPVDETGLAWQVADIAEPRPDPNRDARLAEVTAAAVRHGPRVGRAAGRGRDAGPRRPGGADRRAGRGARRHRGRHPGPLRAAAEFRGVHRDRVRPARRTPGDPPRRRRHPDALPRRHPARDPGRPRPDRTHPRPGQAAPGHRRVGGAPPWGRDASPSAGLIATGYRAGAAGSPG